MLQEIFRIPFLNIPIYGYGLMLVVGFLLAVQLGKFLCKHSAIDPEVFATAALIMLVAGVVGARVSDIFEGLYHHTGEFTGHGLWHDFTAMINIRSGGLTYYGGFLLATPCAIGYALWNKIPIKRGMDIVAPCLMIGLAFGRVGCFLNGCCYGAECNLPWAVSFPYYSNAYVDEFEGTNGHLKTYPPSELLIPLTDGTVKLMPPDLIRDNAALKSLAAGQGSNLVHPTQLYSTITALMLALILFCFYTLPHPPGRVFALMMILEGGTRFLLELIRVEPPVLGQMSLSMLLGLFLVAGGLLMWLLTTGPNDEMEYQPEPLPQLAVG